MLGRAFTAAIRFACRSVHRRTRTARMVASRQQRRRCRCRRTDSFRHHFETVVCCSHLPLLLLFSLAVVAIVLTCCCCCCCCLVKTIKPSECLFLFCRTMAVIIPVERVIVKCACAWVCVCVCEGLVVRVWLIVLSKAYHSILRGERVCLLLHYFLRHVLQGEEVFGLRTDRFNTTSAI